VNEQEEEVVQHAWSCCVHGRSGTGKTTTILAKLDLKERQHRWG